MKSINYRKPAGKKWIYIPEILYDEAQRIHDSFVRRNIEYIMEWKQISKNGRTLTIELNPIDLENAFFIIESHHLGFTKTVECDYEKSEIILEW
jgi:hypothetical protein